MDSRLPNQSACDRSLGDLVDEWCDLFEREWNSGQRPAAANFLQQVPRELWDVVRTELIAIEAEFRARLETHGDRDTSPQRHTEDTPLLEVASASTESSPDVDDTGLSVSDTPVSLRSAPTLIKSPDELVASRLRTEPPATHFDDTLPAERRFWDYELLDEIAHGGMGVVYRARQIGLNRIVALKMIRSGQFAGDEEIQRFQTEAQAAARLDHPGIVPIYEVGQHVGQHFFSMAFIDGPSLAALVKEGPLPPHDAARIVSQIAEAAQYAHDCGIIHRDLKPANVLMANSPASGGRQPPGGLPLPPAIESLGQSRELPGGLRPPLAEVTPKITDFGLAKQIEGTSELTGTGQILGTPSYMPPEQASGKAREIGPAADIYSLGAILYCLLTGRPPFQAASAMDTMRQVLEQEPVSIRQLNAGVPLDLETIALKCLQKDPAKRYATATDVAADLQRFLSGEPITARPVSKPERAWRWCRRNRTVALLVASVMLLSFVVLKLSLHTTIGPLEMGSVAETEKDGGIQPSSDQLERPQMVSSGLSEPLFDGRSLKNWQPYTGNVSVSLDDEGGSVVSVTNGVVGRKLLLRQPVEIDLPAVWLAEL